MKEESQIDEMRAALRGDRERAEERRRSTENVHAVLGPQEPPAEPEPERRRGLIDRLLGR